jgi:hypothetical protein
MSSHPTRTYALISVIIGAFVLLLPLVSFAQGNTGPTLANCTLAGRVASGDGVFNLPGEAQTDPSFYTVACFVSGIEPAMMTAKLYTLEKGSDELIIIGTAPFNFTPPAFGAKITADVALGGGDHELIVRLSNAEGMVMSGEQRLKIRVEGLPKEIIAVQAREGESTGNVDNQVREASSGDAGTSPVTFFFITLFALLAIGYFVYRRNV